MLARAGCAAPADGGQAGRHQPRPGLANLPGQLPTGGGPESMPAHQSQRVDDCESLVAGGSTNPGSIRRRFRPRCRIIRCTYRGLEMSGSLWAIRIYETLKVIADTDKGGSCMIAFPSETTPVFSGRRITWLGFSKVLLSLGSDPQTTSAKKIDSIFPRP